MSGQFPISNWLSDRLNNTRSDAGPISTPDQLGEPEVTRLDQHNPDSGLNIDRDLGLLSSPNFATPNSIFLSWLPEEQDIQVIDTSPGRISLENSMLSHLTCNTCGKSFSSQGRLNSHNHRHEKKHRCMQCDRRFSESRDLRRHIQSVHERIWDQCPQCGKRMKRRGDNLQRHMRRYCKNRRRNLVG
ncbi:uncharacterized protein GGS22DRAFT_13139 [Annulohypoxylon maeteangense]|uniref:uncharacterized protein n=1 Tax=Annulohypoxylon maeteangense TaxID=1927788 RepID=UPI0020078406|nr:uncharacterized protein GGS22DRAFT_13139 [Annulohypoxylon maeteangense]KAI0890403.1 hypothetical protein GGS22DRAFT_13139 [Annulohypoxylon maeteangense]